MGLDLLIPFLILIFLVIYLIYTRSSHEKKIVALYEEKFEQWKVSSTETKVKEQQECKELVGLVFKQGYKMEVELFDEDSQRLLEKGKFNIKVR